MPGRLSGRSADALCAGLVVAANPALYSFGSSSHTHGHDSIAYLTMARGLLEGLTLYLPAWGHVDTGVILPPLFPALIAIGSLVSENALSVPERVSAAASILGGIPLYFLLRPRTHRLVAVGAVVAVQLTFASFEFAFAPLTEALFVALCSCVLLALQSSLRRDRLALAVGTGALCGLVYLTRQLGLLLLPFCLVWIAAVGWIRGDPGRRTAVRLFAVVAGFGILMAPYAALLFQQTGQHPFRQAFRMGHYSVRTDDPLVFENLEWAASLEVSDYTVAYQLRRKMFQLVPDGSEMYGFVRTSRDDDGDDSRIRSILRNLSRNPHAAAANLRANLGHLRGELGGALVLLFFATTVSSVLVRRKSAGFPERLMLPAFACFYLVSHSLITALVARYIVVLIPVLLLSTVAELYRLSAIPLEDARSSAYAGGAGLAMVALCIALMPRHFDSHAPLGGSVPIEQRPHQYFRQVIEAGEPVFSLLALDAYLIGGSFRILPNDSLPRVVEYARRTGVRWIFVANSPHHRNEMQSNAAIVDWYELDQVEPAYPALVAMRQSAVGPRSRFVLYEILPRQ